LTPNTTANAPRPQAKEALEALVAEDAARLGRGGLEGAQ
jgi:hypothetical protein